MRRTVDLHLSDYVIQFNKSFNREKVKVLHSEKSFDFLYHYTPNLTPSPSYKND